MGGFVKPIFYIMFNHDLGKLAKYKITGFSGVLTSRCEFLPGYNLCYKLLKLRQ